MYPAPPSLGDEGSPVELAGIGAIVTGGGSGLGAATTRALVARGARVGILDLGRSPGAELARELGEAAHFFEADVTSEEQVGAAVAESFTRFGSVRAVVNCAGIGSAARTVGRGNKPFDLDVFKRTVEVNLIGTFNTIRLFAARMVENETDAGGERGAIVNTASVAAFEGQIGQAAYSASKGGVVGMTLPIARDLARHGIRCCTIAPGLFETPMLMGMPEEARKALGATIPFPSRLGLPPEYAGLACHILENPMLNGETIRLDGALRMAPR
jgi:NAD(P)-dependent dehydrogenase (short-subunit alcohol dehydrogenase family)